MLISIIIPIYNAECRIRDTVNSILENIDNNCELILVNDVSTDNSGIICDEIAKNRNNVKVIHQKNSGPSAARNTGIYASVGEYIAFVDADDLVDKDWFSMTSKIIMQCNPDLLITGYKSLALVSEKLVIRKINIPSTEFIVGKQEIINLTTRLIDMGLFNPLWNKLYRSKLIKDSSIKLNNKFKLGEDFLFNLDFIQQCNSIYLLNKAPYNYILNTQGLTHSYYSNKFDNLKEVTLIFKEFLIKYNMLLEPYYNRLIRNCFSTTMDLFHKNCNLTYYRKRNEVKKIINDKCVNDMIENYKPISNKMKFFQFILGTKNPDFILLMSKIFHFKKFILDKR